MNIAPKSTVVLSQRHLLGIAALSHADIVEPLDLAEFVELNRQIEKKTASPRGRTQQIATLLCWSKHP